jgi:hypothetical protein
MMAAMTFLNGGFMVGNFAPMQSANKDRSEMM